jgi:hypothetical protein
MFAHKFACLWFITDVAKSNILWWTSYTWDAHSICVVYTHVMCVTNAREAHDIQEANAWHSQSNCVMSHMHLLHILSCMRCVHKRTLHLATSVHSYACSNCQCCFKQNDLSEIRLDLHKLSDQTCITLEPIIYCYRESVFPTLLASFW